MALSRRQILAGAATAAAVAPLPAAAVAKGGAVDVSSEGGRPISTKLLSAKWGPFADDPGSPLMNLGNEAAWDQVYEIELEEFRRRQRAKIAPGF